MELHDGTYTVLARGDRPALTGVVARRGGTRIGNGAFAFSSAAQAVRCAMDLEEETAAQIGLHAGEVAAGEPEAARPVVLARRLASVARLGQVLASALVRELATPTCAPATPAR